MKVVGSVQIDIPIQIGFNVINGSIVNALVYLMIKLNQMAFITYAKNGERGYPYSLQYCHNYSQYSVIANYSVMQ